MLSLLTPAALWLLPLVAAPLVLHFLGRPRPEPRDFPSLLPVRESLREAMRRHRVKNWLQLLLRMLILACLALAAAGPVWRPDGSLPPPGQALVLLHNGAYARLQLDPDDVPGPAEGASAIPTVTTGAAQRVRTLESLTRGNTVVEPLIEHVDVADRLGDPREALARLLRRGDGAAQAGEALEAHVEVFDSDDLAAVTEVLLPWLETHPQARLVLLDRSPLAHRLTAFGPVRARVESPEAPGRAPRVTLYVPVTPEARRAPLWIPQSDFGEGAPRTTQWRDGTASFTTALPDSGWIAGTFRLADDDPVRARHVFAERAAAVEIPPAGDLCRTTAPATAATAASAALTASLGRGGSRLRPRVVSRPEDAGSCRVLALADPSDAELPFAPAARAVVRRGGLVVFEAGPRTSVAAWNRALLEPLGAGRLTRALDVDGGRAARIVPHAPGLLRAGLTEAAARWGTPGNARRVFGFRASADTDTLLMTRAVPGEPGTDLPVLLHHAAYGGDLLVWTTPLDAGAWGDVGAGPWPPLVHHAFGERAHAADVRLRETGTDSLARLPVGARALTAPDGARIPLADDARTVGPFARAGLHRIGTAEAGHGGTAWLAVSVDPRGRAPDWQAFEASAGAVRQRITRVTNDAEWRGLRGGRALRTPLLMLAALLLFAEGLATLRLAPAARPLAGTRRGPPAPRG